MRRLYEPNLLGGIADTQQIALSEPGANFDYAALHIQQALTNMSVGYENGAFVAEQVAPVIPTDFPSDKYWQFALEKFDVYQDDYVPGTTMGELGWSLSSQSFTCNGHGIRGWYPSIAPSAADAVVDLDIETTENVGEAIALVEEVSLLNTLLANLTVTDLSASGGPYQFDNPDNDPVTWFDLQKETIAAAIGKKPNALLLGRKAFRGLRNNPNLLKRFVMGTTVNVMPGDMLSAKDLAAKLDLDEVIVGEAMYNTAALGKTPSLSYIWSDYAVLFFKEATPGRRKVSLAYTFRWNFNSTRNQGLITAGGPAGLFIQKWYDQNRQRQVIDGQKFYTQQIIASGAGLMWKNTVSGVSDTGAVTLGVSG
ncbi:MAG: hypothetical protein KGL39_11450 [Patescibacteria group bacterium]|nr:hypothetical protein [Patescibacteria group bacterium]